MSGPVIPPSGSSSIPSEISPQRQADFNEQLLALITAQSSYQSSTQQILDAANRVIADINEHRDPTADYVTLSALIQDWQTNSSTYSATINSLRTTLEAMATQVVSITPPSGAPPCQGASPFPWLSSEDIQKITNTSPGWPPESLLGSFYTYTNQGLSLIDQTLDVIQKTSAYYNAYSLQNPELIAQASTALNTSAQTLKTRADDWSALRSTLLNNMASFSTTDPIRAVLEQMQAYADTWDSTVIQPLVTQAENSYEAAMAADVVRQTSYSLSSIQSLFTTRLAELSQLTSAAIYPTSASEPTIPRGSAQLSMKQLMAILGKTQLMIQSLSSLLASIDSQLDAFTTSFSLTNLMGSTAGVTATPEAATYNQAAILANTHLYNDYYDDYGVYFRPGSLNVINAVIDQVNQKIDDQNNRASLLASAANTIDPDSINTINALIAAGVPTATLPGPTLSTTTGQSSLQTPGSVTTPVIPRFASLSSDDLPSLPSFSVTFAPMTSIPQTQNFDPGEFDEFNQKIVALLAKIGPLLPAINTALYNAGIVNAGYSFSFPTLYLSQLAPVSNPTILQQLAFILQGFMYGFLLESALRELDQETQIALTKLIEEFIPKLSAIRTSTVETSSTTGEPTMMGLLLQGAMNQSGDIGRVINQLVENEILQKVMAHSIQRAAILAGLHVAGTTPAWVQNLGLKGVPLTEAIEEFSTNGMKTIGEETTQATYVSFAQQLTIEALNEKGLLENARNIVANNQQPLSEADRQELISLIALMQKYLLLAVATIAAMQAGMTIQEVSKEILGVSSQEEKGKETLELPSNTPGLDDKKRALANTLILAIKQLEQPSESSTSKTETPAEPFTPQTQTAALVNNFRQLPAQVQKSVVAAVHQVNFPGIPEETVAATAVAVRTGSINPQVGALLLDPNLSTTTTEIVHRLFTPTPEEIQLKEEDRLADKKHEELMIPVKHPSVVPQSLKEQLREGVQRFYRNTTDETFAKKTFESFAKTVQRLSDFNTVAIDILMNPSKTFVKQFSFLTRSPEKPGQQPPIVFSG